MKYVLSVVALTTLTIFAAAQDTPVAYVGARVIPISGAPIDNGVLVVQRGKIVAVGARGSVQIPAGARTVDVAGKVIMPGLVDSHSHVGGPDGGDASAPLQPDARVLDSLNVADNSLMRARSGGITTANIMPGSGHLLSGQTLYLKLRRGTTIDELLIKDDKGVVAGGVKMANGTNPIRANGTGSFPGTRAKSASLAREQYVKAQEYRDKVKRANGDATKMPARDLNMETLVDVLEGRKIVQFHTHQHNDILTALRIAKEFGFRVVLHHVSEGAKVTKEIKESGAPVSIIIIDSPGGKMEINETVFFPTGAAMEKAGILVGFHTDDPITDSRWFIRSAGLAVRGGMSPEGALRALTINNAKILDLDKRVGSLEAGKDADFIVLSGDPLSVYTKILETWIEGVKVFDLSKPEDRLFALGGPGAGKGQVMDLDEEEEIHN